MLLAMLMLEAMGFVCADYPGYQIFELGLVGFAPRGLEKSSGR